MQGLLPHITVERILYGSDFPYTPLQAVQLLSEEHDKYLPDVVSNKKDQEKMCNGDARKLLASKGAKT
jgi:predicted TIM-barrel fold metal-dependent hydrolase